MEKTTVQIEFFNTSQQEIFSKWFIKHGFDLFTKSKENKGEDTITCLASDEKMEWGHFFELQ